MAIINDAAVGRLNADPNTTRHLQRSIGVAETGVWDAATDAAWGSFAQAIGIDPNYGMTGNGAEWGDLQQRLAAGNPAMEDPAYAAYLRSMGLQQSQIKNEIIARTQAVTDQIARNRAGFEQQKEQATRNTALNFQDRGLGNSGAQYQQQDQQVGAIDYQRQQGEAEQHDALQAYNRGAQNDLSRLATERTNQEYAARERIGMKRAKSVFNPAQG